MGCCTSRTATDDTINGTDNPVPRGGNKPFTRKNVTWTADSPITPRRLKEQRDEFWHTAPEYGGRQEIWQVLRAACESEELEMAQAFLDSANITIPTGNLADGCYDELGTRYLIPSYCIVEPTNLIPDGGEYGEGTSSLDQGDGAKLLPDDSSDKPQTIKVRLSNTAKDILIKVNLKLDTVSTLRQKLCTSEGLDWKKTNVKFFFLGRLLEDKVKLSDINFDNEQVLQALFTEKS